ncbi:MAG TPA: AI-2E family transporter [Rhizomicrobium sp.]|jgi:predicted PurR-regulated permease PerM
MQKIEDQVFILLVVLVTIAFGWILEPFYGAILWGIVIAVLFNPLYLSLRKFFGKRNNLAAATIVLLVIAIVILPLIVISASLGQQASGLYDRIRSGNLDFALYLQRILDALPGWAREALNQFGLTDLTAVRQKLTAALGTGSQLIAARTLSIGLSAFDFVLGLGVMLYLLFFLFRDGASLLDRVKTAMPLRPAQKTILLSRTAVVIRATVKGNISVAAVQGILGGLAFWVLGIPAPLLWTVVMAFLSLLPAIGAGIVWAPVAIYLLATGSVWQGVFLFAYGILVIGLVDNLLRPFLVGKTTNLPDYVVLISTLGGIEVFGLNGFVVGPLIAALFMVIWEIFRKTEQAVD